MLIRATQGGKCRCLGFKPHAQLQNAPHAELGVAAQVEPLALITLQHKGADAVARLDKPGGLQLGNSLSYYGAADTVFAYQRRLGGDLHAGCNLPKSNALSQAGHDFVGQPWGALAVGSNGFVLHGEAHGWQLRDISIYARYKAPHSHR